ncbi:MAG: stage III sporulation protein AF, partial [Clostridia bacterium]|nr:stage III sporulation protein AF [Clostridia bacterium]
MGQYLKTVVSAVLAVGIISVLLPRDSFSKYVNLLAGIIVMAVIISPIMSMRDKKIEFGHIDVEELEFNTNSYIMEEYEKELAQNIKEMLKTKTNINFSVSVRAEKNDDTIEIKEIEISP